MVSQPDPPSVEASHTEIPQVGLPDADANAAADLNIKLATLENIRAETQFKIAQAAQLSNDKRITWTVAAPVFATVFVAVVGLISSAYVTYINSQNQLQLESLRANTTLIVEAVKTGSSDPKRAQDNLKFFLDAGLLQDPDKKISTLLSQGRTPILQSPPSFGEGSQRPKPTDKRVVVKIDQQHQFVLSASIPAVGVYRALYDRSIVNNNKQECEFAGYRFTCIELNKNINTDGEGSAHFIFDRPLPFVAVADTEPSETILLGKAANAQRAFEWGNVSVKAKAAFLQVAVDPGAAWTSLEPMETVQDGGPALAWMKSVIGKKPPNDCVEDPLCGEFLEFNVENENNTGGIVYCAVAIGLGASSAPVACQVYALLRDGAWSIRALLSPQPANGGFGGPSRGLYCSSRTTLSPMTVKNAFRRALGSVFDEQYFKTRQDNAEIELAASYLGRANNSVNEFKENDNVTVHGFIRARDDGVIISGYIGVTKIDNDGRMLELADDERSDFSKSIETRLSRLIGGQIRSNTTCSDIPYFRFGD